VSFVVQEEFFQIQISEIKKTFQEMLNFNGKRSKITVLLLEKMPIKFYSIHIERRI